MVNSATGVAASASMRTITSTGRGNSSPIAPTTAPAAMDQGSGLPATPRRALKAAARPPWPLASCACASAMHSDEVSTMSVSMVLITGPAAAGPSSVASSGTPMKPELGKAATSAPKAASFRFTRAERVNQTVPNTTSSAASVYTPSTTGLSSSPSGVVRPKRNSMAGSAKYRTKALRPGIALSGSTFWRAAR